MLHSIFKTTIFVFLCSLHAVAQLVNVPPIETENTIEFEIEKVADLEFIPWGLDFISSTELLVTDKQGKLYRIEKGEKTEIKSLPEIYVRGQGGLLDVAVSPNFEQTKEVFFTASSSAGKGDGGNTALYKAQLDNDQLINLQRLYKGEENTKKGQHWGSRIVFDTSGHVYFTIGDRGNRDENPQSLFRDGGKVYRLNTDGTIPKDNPFYDLEGAKKAIYCYGNRNPQGLTINPFTQELWESEHGPKGGDEINIIQPGVNYGWPLVTFGKNYSGTTITHKTSAPGMQSPYYYWVPSIAPSGMVFLSSDVMPQWKGNLFIGSLKFQYLERLVIENNKIVKRFKVLENIGRVRNVKQGPDGYLYVAVEQVGILKIIPKSIEK